MDFSDSFVTLKTLEKHKIKILKHQKCLIKGFLTGEERWIKKLNKKEKIQKKKNLLAFPLRKTLHKKSKRKMISSTADAKKNRKNEHNNNWN